MSNCLFEAAYEEILHQCDCTPSFHLVAYKEYPTICSGHKLTCMSKILREIGKYNKVRAKTYPQIHKYFYSHCSNQEVRIQTKLQEKSEAAMRAPLQRASKRAPT